VLNRTANFFVGIFERWMPDPFLFCILLTAACYGLALALTPTGALELTGQWYAGLWQILPFAMQMMLILMTGSALARAGPVRRGLVRIASWPRTQGQAIVLLTFLCSALALLNWGVALVAGGLLAREIARRVPGCDFGFLVAGAYSGFVIFGSGFSSSIILVSATEGSEMNLLAQHTGVAAVPLAETLFTPMNLFVAFGVVLLLPVMFRLMMPRGRQVRHVNPAVLAVPEGELAAATVCEQAPATPAERLERSRTVMALLVLLGGAYLVWHFATRGFALDLYVVILTLLVLGLLLHARPAAYVDAFYQSGHTTAPLLLQFPLYGGIMGMMQQSGLAEVLSAWFVSISNGSTFLPLTYVSAVVLNLFVPSAGGQWAVQGPVVVPAALELGVSAPAVALAVAFGDQACNMFQPFWALPILAIAGLRVRDIMGWCVMTFLLASALSLLALVFLV
jgi:short-chain fatty acids transporter